MAVLINRSILRLPNSEKYDLVDQMRRASKSIPANITVSGFPAKPHETAKRVNAAIQNLPKLYDTVAKLRKKIEELEKWINKGQSQKN